MAYQCLDSAGSRFVVNQRVGPSAWPITVAARGLLLDSAIRTAQLLIEYVASNATPYYGIAVVPPGPLCSLRARDAASTRSADTSDVSQNAWISVVGVIASNTSRTAYANGSGGAASTESTAIGSYDRLCLGSYQNSGAIGDHLLAECAIWSVALTDPEIASLAKGFKPPRIRPQSLELYAPLVRVAIDVRKGITLTPVNSPTVANHPRVY